MDGKIDWPAWQFFFNVTQGIVTVGVAAWAIFSSRNKALKKSMDEMDRAVSCIGNRVTKLETDVVSKDDLGTVYEKISGLSKDVSHLSGIMKKIGNSVDMIHGHLLNKGDKK
ncbi:MAG: hypothetical protein MI862_22350 [Desulfobacterales bacterium]|nr:hypothetical protein [Desulfobacterales bacterium]